MAGNLSEMLMVSSRLFSREGKVIPVECSEDKGRVMLKTDECQPEAASPRPQQI